jgi:hypothetical protein
MESLAPFLQGSCIPCNLPVYPGAPSGLKCSPAGGQFVFEELECTVEREDPPLHKALT